MSATSHPSSPRPSGRQRSVSLLCLLFSLLVAGCGLQTPVPVPTLPAAPTPAPRPTAEPPAAVGGWYVASQAEEPVRVWADLTPREIEALTKSISQRYPELNVAWLGAPDRELYQQALVDARASAQNWDVYVGDSAPLLRASRLALRWTPPESRTIPTSLVDPEGAWYALAVTYHVIQYNTEQIAPTAAPASYEALLDARLFGRLAIEDLSLTWLRGLVEARGREGTSQLVRSLAQQAVTFRNDPRALVVFVTAGQQAAAIDARLDIVEREKRGGGKTAWVGADPVVVQPLGMVVSTSTDRPNGARLVGNYLLSRDAQVILAQFGRVPGRADVDPEPQTLVRGLTPRITLPPDEAAERDLRDLWQEVWGRR